MKSRVAIIALVAVCLWGQSVKADSIVDITATASENGPVDLVAEAWVKPVFGTYFVPGEAFFFTGTEYQIKKLVGTLNGEPITLAMTLDAPEFGNLSWLSDPGLSVGAIYFEAGGSLNSIFQDPGPVLNGDDLPLYFNASFRKPGHSQSSIDPVDPTPEPTSLLLLALGLTGVALRRFRLR